MDFLRVTFLDENGLGPSAERRKRLILEINSVTQLAVCKKVCNSTAGDSGIRRIVDRFEEVGVFARRVGQGIGLAIR